MNYKTAYHVGWLGIFLGIISALTGLIFQEEWLGILGALFLLGGLLWAELFFRCSHCRKKLPVRERFPQHCPFCGCQL